MAATIKFCHQGQGPLIGVKLSIRSTEAYLYIPFYDIAGSTQDADEANHKSQPFFQRYKSNQPTSFTLHYSIRSGVSICGDLMRIRVRIIQRNTARSRQLNLIFTDAGNIQRASQRSKSDHCLPQLLYTISQFYTNSIVYRYMQNVI